LVAPRLFDQKMALGALYRAQLAYELEERLGLEIERDRFSFQVKGIAKEVCEHYSKRRAAIEKELGAKGLESAVAAAIAAKESREIKEVVPPRATLFRQWREEVERVFGLTSDHARALKGKAANHFLAKTGSDALTEALVNLTVQESHFTATEFTRRLAEASQGRGLDIVTIRQLTSEFTKNAARDGKIQRDQPLVYLGTDGVGEEHFTTPEVQASERQLIRGADRLRSEFDHGVSAASVRAILSRYTGERSGVWAEIKHHAAQMAKASRGEKIEKINRTEILRDTGLKLSVEQRAAVRYLTLKGNGSIRALEGAAGTGKTSTLRVARAIWEEAGYQVIGATVSGKARKELEKGSGITSYTTAFLEFVMDKGVGALLNHHGHQLKNLLKGKSIHDFKGFTFTAKHVLVIDEAGMLDTSQITKLIKAVSAAGGMVVMAFDRNQIQAIGPGGAAAALADRYGKVELTNIVRQRDARDIEVVRSIADGKARSALANLADRGLIAVEPTRDKAMERLVADWNKHEKGTNGQSLIFTGANADTQELNRRCQSARRGDGEIGGRSVNVTATIDDQAVTCDLHKRDRVMFLKNNRAIGVNNGETGTVIRIGFVPGFRTVTVLLDDGDKVVVPLKDYQQMTLGYACTSHKGQGSTVDRAYILAGGRMQDREISYVQASRARESTRIYADEHEAGEDLQALARQMERSNQKTLAMTQHHNLAHRH